MTGNEGNQETDYYQEERIGRGTVARNKGGWKMKHKEVMDGME